MIHSDCPWGVRLTSCRLADECANVSVCLAGGVVSPVRLKKDSLSVSTWPHMHSCYQTPYKDRALQWFWSERGNWEEKSSWIGSSEWEFERFCLCLAEAFLSVCFCNHQLKMQHHTKQQYTRLGVWYVTYSDAAKCTTFCSQWACWVYGSLVKML